jgi:hypothetical protein
VPRLCDILGQFKFDFLQDVLGSQGSPAQLLLLKGSEDKLHVRGTLRGFLQTERAAFIQQDRDEDDDKKVEEQEKLPSEEEDDKMAQAQAAASANQMR